MRICALAFLLLLVLIGLHLELIQGQDTAPTTPSTEEAAEATTTTTKADDSKNELLEESVEESEDAEAIIEEDGDVELLDLDDTVEQIETSTTTEEATTAATTTTTSDSTTADTDSSSSTPQEASFSEAGDGGQIEEEVSAVSDTSTNSTQEEEAAPSTNPFVKILGPSLYSLNTTDPSTVRVEQHPTEEALKGKKVVGLYFSADWCGPCRQFTPDLVQFYNKYNSRRGSKDDFEIVWISRCRDMQSWGQYFQHMNWLSLPPDLAMSAHGQALGETYKVKGIPHLVLLDGESASVITYDARTKLGQDKAGVGFPWRNPFVTFYMTVLPKSLRYMIRNQLSELKHVVIAKIKSVLPKIAATPFSRK